MSDDRPVYLRAAPELALLLLAAALAAYALLSPDPAPRNAPAPRACRIEGCDGHGRYSETP